MKLTSKPDPYCAFKDDRERRYALVVRDICRVVRYALILIAVLVAANSPSPAGKVEALLRALVRP